MMMTTETQDIATREPVNGQLAHTKVAPSPISLMPQYVPPTPQEFEQIMTTAGMLARAQTVKLQSDSQERGDNEEQKVAWRRDNYALVMLHGRDYGIGPLQSVHALYVVKGNVAWRGHAFANAIQSHPDYHYEVLERSAERCRIRFWVRNPDGEWHKPEVEVTMDEARRRANNTTMYDQYPAEMLFNRCISTGGRAHCGGAFGYAPPYIEGELESSPDIEARVIVPAATAPADGSTPQIQGDTPKLTEGSTEVEQPKPPPKINIAEIVAELVVAEENSRGDTCPIHKSVFGSNDDHEFINDQNAMELCKLDEAVSFISRRFYTAIKHYNPENYKHVGRQAIAKDGVWSRSVTIHDKAEMALRYAQTGSWDVEDEADLQDAAEDFGDDEVSLEDLAEMEGADIYQPGTIEDPEGKETNA